jgi:uncharacterized protein YndB with AHSA1/START domain
MPPIVSDIEIGRPPDKVFSYVTDPRRFAEWQHDVVSVRVEDAGPPRVGWRFTTTRQIGRVQLTQTQEITEFSPPMRWAVHGLDGPIRADAGVTVEALADRTRSRLRIALDFEGPGIGKLLAPAVRRLAAKQAPRSYRNLKDRLESRLGPSP